jgi:peptidoglycan hydrolase-like protein with peptidoglycan-binding domain
MNWLSLIPTLISAASAINTIVTIANGNSDIVSKIREVLPHLAEPLDALGGLLFPNVKPELRIAAVAMTQYDMNLNKWIQGALNIFLTPSPNLVVDGVYGPKTGAAVAQLQKQLGMTVDGWAGNLVQTALMQLMAKKLGTPVTAVTA